MTLAEELHFGRTAERLHVSVARVSQAIKKQERALGTLLFDRDSRNVRLTPVGRQLRDDLGQVYQGLRHSMDKARLAAQGKTAALRVGMMPNNVHELRPYWDTFRAQYPQWGLHILHAPFADPFAGLRRGEIDVLVTWLPVEEADLTVGPVLFEEPRVLAVSRDHELTGYSSVSVEMVGDFQHVGIESAPITGSTATFRWRRPRDGRSNEAPLSSISRRPSCSPASGRRSRSSRSR
ncbi:LysR family transcriptional regulator [Nonomuraea sp. SYSU D8015]|uniref:LysR family transcriptional regulator n=1 Tax=Nonomuraea sp. SYSU D8015 TaxID=2593644 RepID=UPI0021CF5B94|nr:LysR family transcriptional regulator [Nonomuraea sp. SYSU D8015]